MYRVIKRDKKGEILSNKTFKDERKASDHFVKAIIKAVGHVDEVTWGDIRANNNFFVHKEGSIRFFEKG
jgi:ABC-type uncharacterized transport system auxiliary subunit